MVGALGIDIEVNDLDAALWLGMAGAADPRSLTELDVTDLRQEQAAPLTLWRQARFALTAKLIGQHFLVLLRVAEDDRTEFARIAIVHADDLLTRAHGFLEQTIVGTWHGHLEQDVTIQAGAGQLRQWSGPFKHQAAARSHLDANSRQEFIEATNGHHRGFG